MSHEVLKRANGWSVRCDNCGKRTIRKYSDDHVWCKECQRQCHHEPDDDNPNECFRCGGRIKKKEPKKLTMQTFDNCDRWKQEQQITDLKATIARLEGEVAKLTKDLEREERDHLGTIDHRDQHEERINRIVGCLGLGEYESSWTSHNDPSDRAIEAIEELQRRLEALQPEIIIGKGQAVGEKNGYWVFERPDGKTGTVYLSDNSFFGIGVRYMRCPEFPPRPTFTPPPKPDTLIRHKALADPCWAYRDGTGFRTGAGNWWDSSEVELLDETTGEVRQ